jgi:hypothetical protein
MMINAAFLFGACYIPCVPTTPVIAGQPFFGIHHSDKRHGRLFQGKFPGPQHLFTASSTGQAPALGR